MIHLIITEKLSTNNSCIAFAIFYTVRMCLDRLPFLHSQSSRTCSSVHDAMGFTFFSNSGNNHKKTNYCTKIVSTILYQLDKTIILKSSIDAVFLEEIISLPKLFHQWKYFEIVQDIALQYNGLFWDNQKFRFDIVL